MRLIDTNTGTLEEFVGSKIPRYAILSHTWEEGEVSYKDYMSGKFEGRKGHEKVVQTCRLARQRRIGYAWIDTCCIDKSSSAELTEAINSMYRWYQQAEECYAYLSDLAVGAKLEDALPRCKWL